MIRRHGVSVALLLLMVGSLFEVAAESVVFVTGNAASAEDKLFLANQDGGNQSVLVSGSNFSNVPGRTSVDRKNRRIYVCDQTSGGGGVFRYNADGTGKTTIFSNSTSGTQILGVAADGKNGVVFIVAGNATASQDRLYRCDLDGGNLSLLTSGSSFTGVPNSVAVDDVNQRVYVVDQTTSAGGVFRFNADGTEKTTIYANSTAGSQVLGIAVDASRSFVYFITGNASASEDRLMRCDLNGANPTTLVSGSSLSTIPGQVAIDITENRIYVADQTTAGGGVFRFNADGTGKTTIYSNTTSGSQVLGLSILPPPGTTLVSLNRAEASPSGADTVQWTATFETTVTGLTGSNFSLSGEATTGATIGTPSTANGGLTWTIPVTTGSGSGTLQLNLANSTGLTPAITTTLPFSGQAYSMDQDSPTVSIGAPSEALTQGGPISFIVTYSDANFSSSTLSALDVTVNSTGTASVGSWQVTGSGSTRTVTLSDLTGDGTLGISIGSETASDTVGNVAGGAGPSTTVTVDNTAPTISISTPPAFTRNGPVNFIVTWTGQSSISLAAPEIVVNQTGTVQVGSISVSGVGNTRTVSLSDISGDGTVGFSLPAGTASDAAGNLAGSAGPSAFTTVDNTVPAISISAPSSSSTATGPVTFEVTYSDANFDASTLSTGQITLNKSGTADGTLEVTGSGTTRTVTVSNLSGGGNLGISIASGTASDVAGNVAPAAGPSAIFAVLSAPTVTTEAATSVTVTTAVLNATINPLGSATTAGFESGLDTNYGTLSIITLSPDDGGNNQAVTATLTGLTPNTTYHYRAVATNNLGITFGADLTLTTAANTAAPTAIGLSASSIMENQPVGTTLGILSATDSDVGDTTTFALVSGVGSTDNSSFEVVGTELRSTVSFNFEIRNSYLIRLRVTDAGGLSFEDTFTITISDENEPPTFSSYRLMVAQNTVATVSLPKLLAKTSDPEGVARTVAGVGATSSQGGTVALLGNSVRYTPPLNFTGDDTFQLTITDGVHPILAIVQVTVTQGTSGPGATLVSINFAGGDAQLSFASIPGTRYEVQRSGNLSPPVVWTVLDTATADSSGFIHFTDSVPPSPSYWRAVVIP